MRFPETIIGNFVYNWNADPDQEYFVFTIEVPGYQPCDLGLRLERWNEKVRNLFLELKGTPYFVTTIDNIVDEHKDIECSLSHGVLTIQFRNKYKEISYVPITYNP